MATRLTDMEIVEISIVDEPANDAARVEIFKAKGGKPKGSEPDDDSMDEDGKPAKGKKPFPMAKVASSVLKALTDLAPQIVEKALAGDLSADPDAAEAARFFVQEISMDLQSLQTALADAEGKLSTLEKRATDAEAALAAKDDVIKAKDAEIAAFTKGEDDDADILKSLPESIRKRIEAAEASAKAAEELVAKAKAEADEKEAVAKARDLKIGEPEKLGPLLLRVAKGRSSQADADALTALLKSAGEVTSKSPLFKALGSDAKQEGSPEDLLKAKATEIQKANAGMTYEAAYSKALDLHPELYADFIAKRRVPVSAD